MNAKGLNTFVDKNSELTREYELHDKRIIIDGSNFVHFLYTRSRADFIFGGDYKVFAGFIRSYMASLQECCVEPVVVFDGGLNKCENMFEKRMKSHKNRLESVFKLTKDLKVGKNKQTILPISAYEVFKMVLLEIGVKVIQCEFKEDHSIAALANEYECPVLSNDSDFYIFHLRYGFIRLRHLNTNVQITTNGKKCLKCRIYYVESFISHFSLRDKNVLALFATLLLYQNEYPGDGNNLFKKMKIYGFKEKIPKLLQWLEEKTYEDAFNRIVKLDGDRGKDLEIFLRAHEKNYQLKTSNLKHIGEDRTDEIIQKSELSTNCGAKLPDNFILAFHKGLPSSLFTILTRHCQFLSPLIEDFTLESSHSCSRYIRAATYGVLLQHEKRTSKSHDQNCLKFVNECDRKKSIAQVNITEVNSLRELQNGVKVPMLSDIYRMEKPKLRDFIKAVLDVEEAFINNFTSDLQLFFCCVNYWLRNCAPKPSDNLITSILLCVIYHQISSFRVSAGERALLFQNISESDAGHVLQNFKMYLKVPSEETYDLQIVHSFNQLQICFLDAIQLNWLTEFPFVSPMLHETFSGTMLYNLAKDRDLDARNLLGNIDETIVWYEKTKELLEKCL